MKNLLRIVLIVVLLSIAIPAVEFVQAAGWLAGYSYKQEITITQPCGNNTETPGTDYQVPILVDAGSNDGSEFMFVTMDYFPTLNGKVGYQGIAQDGNYVYTFDSTDTDGTTNNNWIRKWDITTQTLDASRGNCLADAGGALAGWHGFSDGNILEVGGNIYITVMESSVPAGDSAVMVYTQDLVYVAHVVLTGDDGMESIDYYDSHFWTCYWKHDYVRKYNTSWVLQATYNVADPDNPGDGFQSIVWKNDGSANILLHQHGGEINEYSWSGAGFSLVREIQIEGHFNGGVTPPDIMYTEDKGMRWFTPMAKGTESSYSYWMASESQYYGAGVGSDSRVYRFELTNGAGYGTVNLPIVFLDDKCDSFPTDIRFTDDDGTTPLDYYLDPKEGTATRRLFWAEVADSMASSYGELATIDIYYGKVGASDAGNGSNCFIAWDDFDYQYNVGDPLKWQRGWTTFGVDPITIQNNPDGSGKVIKIAESGDAATSAIANIYSAEYPVSVHYRGYQTTTYYTESSKYYVAPAVFATIQKGGAGGTVYWYDGAAYQDFTPTKTFSINDWFKAREYANDNIPGGRDLILNLWNQTYEIYTSNYYGDYRAARLADEYKWLMTCASGASAIDLYIDDFFVRKAIYYEPFMRMGVSEPPTNVYSNDATNVEESTVTLNGNNTIISGGNVTIRGFCWGTTSQAAPGNTSYTVSGYATCWSENGDWGNVSVTHGIDSLSPGTCYYFRYFGFNSWGWNWGLELSFLTKPNPPVGLLVTYIDDATLDLTWAKGAGADETVIRHKTTGYPATYADGNETYDDTGISYTHSGLDAGYTYYYCGWSRVTACGETKYSDASSCDNGNTSAAGSVLELSEANVFRSYLEPNDMLFVIQYTNTYTPYYLNYEVHRYFSLQLLDTDGTTVLANTACKQWGMMPGSVYLSADYAATLTPGDPYVIRLYGTFEGNPYDDFILRPQDWRGDDLFFLGTWCLTVAGRMETYYSTELTLFTGEDEVLNTEGGVIFNTGIPALGDVIPDLFEITVYEGWVEAKADVDPWKELTSDDMLGPDIEAAVDLVAAEYGVEGEDVSTFGYLAVVVLLIGIVAGFSGMQGALIICFPLLFLGGYLRVMDMWIVITLVFMAAGLFLWSKFGKQA